jgi:hypothetical protein
MRTPTRLPFAVSRIRLYGTYWIHHLLPVLQRAFDLGLAPERDASQVANPTWHWRVRPSWPLTAPSAAANARPRRLSKRSPAAATRKPIQTRTSCWSTKRPPRWSYFRQPSSSLSEKVVKSHGLSTSRVLPVLQCVTVGVHASRIYDSILRDLFTALGGRGRKSVIRSTAPRRASAPGSARRPPRA